MKADLAGVMIEDFVEFELVPLLAVVDHLFQIKPNRNLICQIKPEQIRI